MDLQLLRHANYHRDLEWDPGHRLGILFKANELAGELGEACNVVKKLERERLGIKGSRETVEHLAEELADIIICVDLLAMHVGINLSESIVSKFNKTSKKQNLNIFLP